VAKRTCVQNSGLIGAALLVTPGLTRVASSDRSIVLAVGALAGWAVIDAAFHDNPRAAVPYVVLLAGVVAVLVACSRLDEAARDLLLTGLIAGGILVAALGWLGLVLHDARWTWQGQGLWRASSTLPYPNATAVILAMLALLAVARLTEAPRSVLLLIATLGVVERQPGVGDRTDRGVSTRYAEDQHEQRETGGEGPGQVDARQRRPSREARHESHERLCRVSSRRRH
jgi:hypothetical protein